MISFYEKVLERFIRYVKIDTQSIAGAESVPSTQKQFHLAKILVEELREMGAQNIELADNCCIYSVIPATVTYPKPYKIGFIAHMDTSPDAEGTDVKPWIFKNYDGGDVVLNKDKNIVLDVAKFPKLKNYIGDDLVFTDGTTLLGGDDKASIAAIMTAAEYLCKHPEIPHGDICIGFTPDEEVGRGAAVYDIKKFGADLAYTLDGSGIGGIYDETFNGWEAQLNIKGVSVHPGNAKGAMKNAVEIAAEFIGMLPAEERPQFTEGREGYYHPFVLNATVENAFLRCLIRDHDRDRYYARKALIEKCVDDLNEKYGENTVNLEWVNQYFNMGDIISKVPFMITYAEEAMRRTGLEPYTVAMRGGTDGAWLSQSGLPCPNITAGYEYAHGHFESVSIQSMEKNVNIILELVRIYAEHAEDKQ